MMISMFNKTFLFRFCRSIDGRWSIKGHILPWFSKSQRDKRHFDGTCAVVVSYHMPYAVFMVGFNTD